MTHCHMPLRVYASVVLPSPRAERCASTVHRPRCGGRKRTSIISPHQRRIAMVRQAARLHSHAFMLLTKTTNIDATVTRVMPLLFARTNPSCRHADGDAASMTLPSPPAMHRHAMPAPARRVRRMPRRKKRSDIARRCRFSPHAAIRCRQIFFTASCPRPAPVVCRRRRLSSPRQRHVPRVIRAMPATTALLPRYADADALYLFSHTPPPAMPRDNA